MGPRFWKPSPAREPCGWHTFFAGVKHKASVAEELEKLCAKEDMGLVIYEVDVLIGGSEHDLLDRVKQDAWLARIEDVDFDVILLSPPCGTWSRANWADDDCPKPCRNRKHPWGIPHMRAADQIALHRETNSFTSRSGLSPQPRRRAATGTPHVASSSTRRTSAGCTEESPPAFGNAGS